MFSYQLSDTPTAILECTYQGQFPTRWKTQIFVISWQVCNWREKKTKILQETEMQFSVTSDSLSHDHFQGQSCCILFKLTGRRYISFVLLNWDLSIVIVKLYLHKLPFQKAFMIKRFTERRFFLVLSLFTERQGYAGWQIVLLSSRLLLPTAAAWALPSFYLCKFVLLRWRLLKSHSIPELIKNMYQCGYIMTLTYETRKKFHLSKAYL